MQNRPGRFMRQIQVIEFFFYSSYNRLSDMLKPWYAVGPVLPHSSILHHYDCNHEMNHFEDELRWSLHLFSHLFFPRQPHCGQVRENVFSKHNKSQQQAQWILTASAESIFIYTLQYNGLMQVLS